MQYWMLTCPKCRRDFVHSKIELTALEEARRDAFGILPKPPFALDGEKHICPECKTESVFQRHHLFYRDDTSDFRF
jgi:hypothetical protein